MYDGWWNAVFLRKKPRRESIKKEPSSSEKWSFLKYAPNMTVATTVVVRNPFDNFHTKTTKKEVQAGLEPVTFYVLLKK